MQPFESAGAWWQGSSASSDEIRRRVRWSPEEIIPPKCASTLLAYWRKTQLPSSWRTKEDPVILYVVNAEKKGEVFSIAHPKEVYGQVTRNLTSWWFAMRSGEQNTVLPIGACPMRRLPRYKRLSTKCLLCFYLVSADTGVCETNYKRGASNEQYK